MAEGESTTSSVQRILQRAGFGGEAEEGAKKLGTFTGVFRPTLLTILGLMLYLRAGWVVGNAGLLGALSVLALSFLITGATALSVSTITTNIKLGTGGAFALVSQSLGLEAGGAIGIPLYLALSMSAALYIYGLVEGWAYIFPSHPTWAVLLVVYFVSFALSLIDVKLAFRLHIIVLVALVGALVSMAVGAAQMETLHSPQWIGDFENASFWRAFSVFFPAASGIMVGVSMSGQLEDPRRSIPRGVMGAWALAFVVYGAVMVWYALVESPEVLSTNYLVSFERSAVPQLVQIGLVACCSSAALGSFVAAPQVLFALGQHRLLPHNEFFTQTTKKGVYRNAALVTGAIIGATLLLGDLDRVAKLITMFFLITYATLNVVLLVEQSLALISFRPTFRVPITVPMVGAAACIFAIMITAPAFGLIALSVVVGIYLYLASRQLDTPWETVRSGIFLALADWAAKKTQGDRQRFERAWKPDVMVPITKVEDLDGKFRFLRGLAWPKGSLQILGIETDRRTFNKSRLDVIVDELQQDDLFATAAVIEGDSLSDGVQLGASVLKGAFFKPNVVFLDASQHSEEEVQRVLDLARRYEMGCAFLMPHPVAGLGHERRINIWVRDQSPNWELGLRLANIDLTLLLAYQLGRNWRAQLRMLSIVGDESDVENADYHLKKIYRDARIPGLELSWVRAGRFQELIAEAPHADLHLMGLSYQVNKEKMRELCEQTGASCLFVLDSGYESAFA